MKEALLLFLLLLAAVMACRPGPVDPGAVAFCEGQAICAGKNPRVANVRVLQQQGARPHWSPAGDRIVFDRKNADGFSDVYVSDLHGTVVASVTEGKTGINQRNNGNALYHPSGASIVFVSEERTHFGEQQAWLGDPGLGMFSNLWATDPAGTTFWKLTNIPIKQTLQDRIPAMAVVNPRFSWDGSLLVWTERYAEGGNHNWGKWRLKAAEFVVGSAGPTLRNERVIFTPSVGTYVTAMEFMTPRLLLVAGNLDGQHEYGMDLYLLDLPTRMLHNLTNSPTVWEEGACIAPSGKIVYMTNVGSRPELDFTNANWPSQPLEREYWVMDANGANKERLTYFNDQAAPEYLGRRIITAVCDVSPDGLTIATTLGVDFGDEQTARVELKLVLLELAAD